SSSPSDPRSSNSCRPSAAAAPIRKIRRSIDMNRAILSPINRFCLGYPAAAIVCSVLLLTAGCATTTSKEHPSATQSKAKSEPTDSNLARTFEEAVTRGDEAWSSGHTDMAVYCYIQALSFKPRDVTTLGKLGSIEQAQGDLTLAARAFELAANADPGDARLS